MASYTRCLSLPVAAGVSLVALVYYTVLVLVIRPWMGLLTANGLLHALGFSLSCLLILWCYALCVLKDPGPVPAAYAPQMADQEAASGEGLSPVVQEVKRKGGQLRFCQKCSCFKPPRAHHCRVCKRCVLRMDHHCMWINNCVGHRNYKAFLLFVFYDVLALSHALALILTHTASCLSSHSALSPAQCLQRDPPPDSHPTWLDPSPTAAVFIRVLCIVLSLPAALSLSVLLIWHLYLVAHNKTTIEHSEGVRATLLGPRVDQLQPAHPYDLGVPRNIDMIMGPNPLCWVCPSAVSHLRSGLRFPTAYDQSAAHMGRDL